MFALVSLLLSPTLVASAEAAAELQFRSTSPVLFYVDGQPAAMMGNLKMRARDLAPGTHEVRVTGIFGKVLYEGEIDLPDGMITHTEWMGRQLTVVRTEALAEPEAEVGPWTEPTEEEEAIEAEEVQPELGEAAVEMVVEDEPPVASAVDPTSLPTSPRVAIVPVGPVSDEAEPPEPALGLEPEPAIPPPMADAATHALALPVGVAPARARVPSSVVRVAAQEGMTLEVTHADVVVRVTVRDGAFVVEDAGGVSVTFGAPRALDEGSPALVKQEPSDPSDG